MNMDKTILEMLQEAQNDPNAMYRLVTKFEPLVTKFAKRLNYEDAHSEITLLFIEKIQKIDCNRFKATDDYTLLKYIKKVVENISCDLSRGYISRLRMEIPVSNKSFEHGTLIKKQQSDCLYNDEYSLIIQDLLERLLTPYQVAVIKAIVLSGYPVNQVAKQYGVTPEAITITKNRALKKLRIYYERNM